MLIVSLSFFDGLVWLDFMAYKPLEIVSCQTLFKHVSQTAGAAEYTDRITAER